MSLNADGRDSSALVAERVGPEAWPADYIGTYYATVMEDERALIAWLAGPARSHIDTFLNRCRSASLTRLLDVGSGPTVHHMLSLCTIADEIVVSDLELANRTSVTNWLERKPEATDWIEFSSAIVRHEGCPPERTESAAREREELLRRRLRSVRTVDLTRRDPLERDARHTEPERFEIVTSFFCADSATGNRKEFRRMIRRLATLVEPGGLFLGAFLGGCSAYRVGAQWTPSADLTHADLIGALTAAGLPPDELTRIDTPELSTNGFDHVYVAASTRTARRFIA